MSLVITNSLPVVKNNPEEIEAGDILNNELTIENLLSKSCNYYPIAIEVTFGEFIFNTGLSTNFATKKFIAGDRFVLNIGGTGNSPVLNEANKLNFKATTAGDKFVIAI